MKINKKTLGMFVIVTLIIGACFFFSKDLRSDFIAQVAYGSSLESSSAPAGTAGSANSSDKISSDLAFLSTLTSLKSIMIDTSFFNDKVFGSLVDNRVSINDVDPGRPNPFAPIGDIKSVTNETAVSSVVTVNPTEITSATANLNGTINTTEGVTDIYFEYGKTESLGTVAPVIKPSLVGNFIKNISGLTPKSNYFFKACAKIKGVATCGDVISFNTK